MLVSGIKSKPVYEPLRADTRGRYHLMLGLGPGAAPLLRVLAELEAATPEALARTRVLYVPETDPAAPSTTGEPADHSLPAAEHESSSTTIADSVPSAGLAWSTRTGADSSRIADSNRTIAAFEHRGLAGVQPFRDAAALLAEFRALLERSLMGTRLYVAGPESFIGLAMRTALEFNLNKDEIRAEEAGTRARRVHCVHCRTATENVRTNIVTCTGCGRWLLVRDHYSRRLAAYMGVMVDAEAPGELPAIQEVYS